MPDLCQFHNFTSAMGIAIRHVCWFVRYHVGSLISSHRPVGLLALAGRRAGGDQHRTGVA